jgi:hypothetical protein
LNHHPSIHKKLNTSNIIMNANNNNNNNEVQFVQVVIDLLGGRTLSTCSICLKQVVLWEVAPNPGELAVEPDSSCGHIFHQHCIQDWVDTGKHTCPNCNANFGVSVYKVD